MDEKQRYNRILDLLAQQHKLSDECEVDTNPTMSEGDDNGCFVQAWLWVDFTGTDLDKEKY